MARIEGVGMPKETSGGIVNHPVVNNIDWVDPYMSKDQKKEWLKNTMSVELSEQEINDTIDAAENYSLSGYTDIHNGNSPKETALIDAMIEDPNAPVYGKTQYRGIHVSRSDINGADPKEWVEDIIKTGVWKEPGVSSFSSSESTAKGFGHFGYGGGDDEVHILIVNNGHTTGMPFKHLSECTSENEVLHSAKQMLKGMAITGYYTKNGNEYYIHVDDSKKIGKAKKHKLDDLLIPSF